MWFCIAKEHERTSMSHTNGLGTLGYTAPEISYGSNGKSQYTTKADVYSLGKITQNLYDFDINSWVMSKSQILTKPR